MCPSLLPFLPSAPLPSSLPPTLFLNQSHTLLLSHSSTLTPSFSTQILTRRKFGEGADPWLALNLVVFSVFCVVASTLYFLPGLWMQGPLSPFHNNE